MEKQINEVEGLKILQNRFKQLEKNTVEKIQESLKSALLQLYDDETPAISKKSEPSLKFRLDNYVPIE